MASPALRRDEESPTSPRSSRPPPSSLPFPHYDPSQRLATRSQSTRRSSTASSIGGVLDTTAHTLGSSIEESSNNAISTLLQPPIVRTGLLPHATGPSAPKPPSTRDIPPVTLPTIPHVDNNVFKPYLSQAGALYEIFRHAKEESEEVGPASPRRGSKIDEAVAGLSHGMQRRLSSSSGLSRLDVPISPLEGSPTSRRRSSGGVTRRSALTVAPLSTIPMVYFDQGFHLENPRTFDVVSEKAEIVRPPPVANGDSAIPSTTGKALAANAILQEKLSWYMDTVEIHLISSISTASNSFFAALGSLRELHAEAAGSVAKIQNLREDLKSLDEGMAIGGLKIVSKRRRGDNVRKLGDAVHQLQAVMESVSKCEEEIDKGEIDLALNGLEDVERLIAGDYEGSGRNPANGISDKFKGNLIDLRGVKALEGAGNDIAFLRKRVGKAHEAKFMETLLGDIRRHVDHVPASSTFQRWDKASSRLRGQHIRTPSDFPAYLQVGEEFRSLLRIQLKGLARSDSIMSAALSYREAILREFKNLIRRHLPSSNDDDAESTASIMTTDSRARSSQEKSSILARNLRNLESEDAEEMFKNIYSNVGEALRRLSTQVKLLLDITSSLGNPHASLRSPARSPSIGHVDQFINGQDSPNPSHTLVRQEEIQQALDLSNLLGQAVDISQSQITKVLKVRVEQTTHLDLPYFLRYFTINRLFADECEAVSGRGGSALKTVVHDHIKSFVNLSAEGERQRLVQTMDADKWDAKDFAEDDVLRLGRVLEASTKDVEAWSKLSSIWDVENENHSTPKAETATNGTSTTTTKDKVRSAIIDEQKYILPASALAVARGMEDFEKLLTGIPSMGGDISTYLIEYLKLFNSRAWQLILGAGATKSAGLKNITTRHLALSSQALSFVIALVPYVREFARRHLPTSSTLVTEFDKVRRIFQEHQSAIHDKLVEIMTGRAVSHVNAMRKIDWDTAADQETASPYMETLVKETATLHKVLARYLADGTVGMIMGPVIADYREQWAKAFGGVVVKTQAGKNRLLRDAEHFRSRISKLECAGDVGDFIVKIAEEKVVQAPEVKVVEVPAPNAILADSKAAAQEVPKVAPEETPAAPKEEKMEVKNEKTTEDTVGT